MAGGKGPKLERRGADVGGGVRVALEYAGAQCRHAYILPTGVGLCAAYKPGYRRESPYIER